MRERRTLPRIPLPSPPPPLPHTLLFLMNTGTTSEYMRLLYAHNKPMARSMVAPKGASVKSTRSFADEKKSFQRTPIDTGPKHPSFLPSDAAV